jgi:DNA repair exonuclease SbcCD nuclease subunit
MSKVLILGDLHFRRKRLPSRLNDPYQVIEQKLKDIFQARDISSIIFLGDVFDEVNPSVSTVISFLDMLRRLIDVSIYTIVGNHDLFSETESVFDLGTQIQKIDSELQIGNVLFRALHYYNKLPTERDEQEENVILLSHKMIVPQIGTVPTPEEIAASVASTWGYKIIVTGHYHNSFDMIVDNCRIINPGVIYRNGGEIDIKAYGLILDTSDLSIEKIPLLRIDDFKQKEVTETAKTITQLLTQISVASNQTTRKGIEDRLLNEAPLLIKPRIVWALKNIKR